METKNDISPIEIACDLAGGQSALASLLGVSAPTVNQWVKKVRPVPPLQAFSIETTFKHDVRVSRKAFFPDSWATRWPELAQSEAA